MVCGFQVGILDDFKKADDFKKVDDEINYVMAYSLQD